MTAQLVSTDWLESHLSDPRIVVVEVSLDPADRAAFTEAHVPGSRWVYWSDFCWHPTDRQFAGPDLLAERLGKLGAGKDSTVVLVGDPVQFGAYAYWVLAMAGFEPQIRLLDGGRQAWLDHGKPISADSPPGDEALGIAPTTPSLEARVGRRDVRQRLDDPDRVLVDMRSPEEYSGARVSPPHFAVDHGAQRGGHIPGAVHLYYERLLQADGTLKPEAELRSELADAGVVHDREIVTYCRLSHRASLGWFVLTRVLGYPDVKVYDGSWTEWGSIVDFPIER